MKLCKLALPDIRSAASNTIGTLIIIAFLAHISFIPAQRAIQNPSVQNPAIANNSNERIAENTLIGWLTTHPIATCGVGPASCRPIERWSSGFLGVNASTDAGAGNAWVELNADVNSMIYQPVCMTNGESFTYSFLHRGRSSSTVGDQAQFRMGIPTGLPTGSRPADSYSFPIATATTANDGNPRNVTNNDTTNGTTNTPVLAGNGWARYGGTYTYTGPTQVVNLGFRAVSTAGGDLSVGNFIDNWSINLAPYIEASAVSTSAPEGEGGGSHTPALPNAPALRISGTVTTAATIQVSVTGGTATIGSDYSLTVPFQLNNTNNSVVINVPSGSYDGVSTGIFPLPFSTIDDHAPEPDETVIFTIGTVTGAQLASLSACGTAPIISFTHTIVNDDIVTSAPVEITGRVVDLAGRGIPRAHIRGFAGRSGELYATTNPFGYFRINGVHAGDTITLVVNAKNRTFLNPAQTFIAFDSIYGIEFNATN